MAEISGAFQSLGRGIAILASQTAPSPQQAKVDEGYPSGGFMIVNDSQHNVVLGFGATPEEAVSRAIAPTPSEPSYGIVLVAGTVIPLTFPPNSYFTATTQTGSHTVYMWPGIGL